MINRTVIFAASVCIALTSAASAIQLTDFVGVWTGQRTETQNGSGTYTTAKLAAKMANGNLSVNETGTSATIGSYTFKHSFKSNGKYKSYVISYGFILSTCSGSWKKDGSTISISGTQSSSSGNTHFSGSLKFVSSSKIVYTGKSGDVTIKISAKRS